MLFHLREQARREKGPEGVGNILLACVAHERVVGACSLAAHDRSPSEMQWLSRGVYIVVANETASTTDGAE